MESNLFDEKKQNSCHGFSQKPQIFNKIRGTENSQYCLKIFAEDYVLSLKSINTIAEHPYLVRINASNYLEEDKESNSSAVFKTLIESCFFNNFSSVHSGQLNFNASAMYCTSLECFENNLQASGMNWQNSCSGNNLILSLKTGNTSKNSVSVLCALDSNSSLLLMNSSRINSGAINSMFLDKNISLDDLFPFISKENNSLASITTSIHLNLLENLFDSASLTFFPKINASSCVNSLSFEKDSSILSCTIFFSNASLATSDQFITLNSDNSFFNSSEIAIVKFGILSPGTFKHINTLDTHVYKCFDNQKWLNVIELDPRMENKGRQAFTRLK